MLRLMVEGVKCSGKSTVVDLLREHHRPSTVIEYRAYFIEGEKKYTYHNNAIDKLFGLSDFLSVLSDDSIILLRGHLFPFALGQSLGKENYNLSNKLFGKIDSIFHKNHFTLILLTLNSNEFLKRNGNRIKSGRKVDNIDRDLKMVMQMQENYLNLFYKSCMNKILVDTTEKSIGEIANYILGNINNEEMV